jgi:putative adhesin
MQTQRLLPIAVVIASSLGLAPADVCAQRAARAPETDQTVQVPRGSRLVIENFAGDVIVSGWDRDTLRVQARHPSRTRVNVRPIPTGFRVSASSDRGPQGSVDYDINVPNWMPVRVEGHFNYVTVQGTQAEVSVDTNRGDIVIKGGSGVTVKSTEGNISVENAAGKINLSTVNEGIAIAGSSGEIAAETVNGPIILSNMRASNVEAGTINGNIAYEGTVANDGRYRLTSHNGSITVAVPETSNATFAVRTYTGSFNSGGLPVKGDGDVNDVRRGRRVVFTLGTGSAEFELESFSGGIRLLKPGTTAVTTKRKDKE